MAIKPVKFGPYFWGTLHLACLGGIDPVALRTLVAIFPSILPCPVCGIHFTKVLADNPLPDTTDPDELFRWSVDVHNVVNRSLEKPVFTYTEALDTWIKLPASTPIVNMNFDFKLLIILILLAILGFIIYVKK